MIPIRCPRCGHSSCVRPCPHCNVIGKLQKFEPSEETTKKIMEFMEKEDQ